MAEIIYNKVSYSESECINLDLNVVNVLGVQNYLHDRALKRIIDAIENKIELPPVFLVPHNPDLLEYRLTLLGDYHDDRHLSLNRGGHHRVFAHYVTNTLMRSLILKSELVELYDDVALPYWHKLLSPIRNTNFIFDD